MRIPKLKQLDKRTEVLTVRMSKGTRAALEALVKHYGLSQTDVVTQLIEGAHDLLPKSAQRHHPGAQKRK